MRHPNIVSLHKVIDTGTTVVLLLELITGGELFHWMPSNEAEAAHVVGFETFQIYYCALVIVFVLKFIFQLISRLDKF